MNLFELSFILYFFQIVIWFSFCSSECSLPEFSSPKFSSTESELISMSSIIDNNLDIFCCIQDHYQILYG